MKRACSSVHYIWQSFLMYTLICSIVARFVMLGYDEEDVRAIQYKIKEDDWGDLTDRSKCPSMSILTSLITVLKFGSTYALFLSPLYSK
jgi:hypothetical protein